MAFNFEDKFPENPTRRCFGSFELIDDIIRDNIEEVHQMFSIMKFVPFRAESMFNNTVKYSGYSPLFKEIPKYNTVPEYRLTIESDGQKIVKVDVEEIR